MDLKERRKNLKLLKKGISRPDFVKYEIFRRYNISRTYELLIESLIKITIAIDAIVFCLRLFNIIDDVRLGIFASVVNLCIAGFIRVINVNNVDKILDYIVLYFKYVETLNEDPDETILKIFKETSNFNKLWVGKKVWK